jgi:hypothetical protein
MARKSSGRPGGDSSPTGQGGGRGRSESPDRYLRDLVGGGRTNLSGPAAARVRDMPELSAEELAAAERDVVIQRRKWTPT